MLDIKELISENEIKKRIEELAIKIMNDYEDKEIYVVSVLTGAAYFTIDLTKRINNNINLQFIKVSSYGNNEYTSGKPILEYDLKESIKGKDVLIIEDIADSGVTLDFLIKYLKSQEPNSLKVCVLLNKKTNKTIEINYDYIGFNIDNKFVIGYGLDYKNTHRNLPYIGYIDKQ